MKKVLFLFAAMLVSMYSFAQSYTEEVDFFQALYGMEKKAIVEEFVQPATTNRVPFWEVYDEYEVKRKALGKERIDLLVELDEKFAGLTNEDADLWMKKVIALSKSQDKLIDTYYKKMKKVTSPIVAMRFYMLEAYLLTVIRYEILDAIPFPEEAE
jgi:hypothetical protein